MKYIALLVSVLISMSGFAAEKALPFGIYFLPTKVSTSSAYDNPNLWGCFTSPEVNYMWGCVARVSMEYVENSEGTFNWTYLDAVQKKCYQNGMYWEMSVYTGADANHQFWPSWLVADGVKTFTLHDGAGSPVVVPLPWDTIFQSKLKDLITALSTRYNLKHQLHCIQMHGPGRSGELNFSENGTDYTALQTAYGSNWATALWVPAAEAIAGLYVAGFPGTPVIYSNGRPLPKTVDSTNQTMLAIATYLNNQFNQGFPWIAGTRDSGYFLNGNPDPYYANPGIVFTGYQQNAAKGDGAGPEALQMYQSPYFGLWFEVYDSDCADSNNYPDFNTMNNATFNPNENQ